MPTYEYACESCGNRYEKREGFDAKARQKCPSCGKMAQRLLSAPAVVFKGTGFYKTDSRGSSDSSEATSAPETTTMPAADSGHSHGPGGHTHDTPAPAATPTADATATPAKKTTPATESAAAS